MKLCLQALDQDVHPSARPSDFVDQAAYELWKKREKAQINQLIIGMATQNPELAKRPSIDFPKPLLEQERMRDVSAMNGSGHSMRNTTPMSQTGNQYQQHGYPPAGPGRPPYMHQPPGRPQTPPQQITTPYTFIPQGPREYYKILVKACLDAELRTRRTLDDGKFFGAKSIGVLKECGLRWRLVPTFRVIA